MEFSIIQSLGTPSITLHGNWEKINLWSFYGILVSINLSKVTIKNTRGTFIHVALISFLFTLNSYLLTCAFTWFIVQFLKIFIKRIKLHISVKQGLRSSLILNKDTRVPSWFINAFINSILLDQIYFIEEPANILFYNIWMKSHI